MVKRLGASSLKVCGQESVEWEAKPEGRTTLAEVLAPTYWAHHARMLTTWAKIRVLPQDGTWYAELIVRKQRETETHVELLLHKHFGRDAEDAPSLDDEVFDAEEITIRDGGRHGWQVLRLPDRYVLVDKLDTKEQAEAWAAARTRKQAA